MTRNSTSVHDVFISFASEDRELANQIEDRLSRDGINVWRFTDSPEAGTWHLNQLRALRDSKIAIFIVTPSADNSSACLDEAQRAADPTRLGTVPIPVVIGAWNHEESDLWLLLSKWNGVVASPVLDEEALRRLLDIVHDRLGFRPVAALSTGQALAAVKDDLCAFLDSHDSATDSEILDEAHRLQVKHRGNMVAFSQFTYLDRELQIAGLINDMRARNQYLSRYLRSYFEQIVGESYSAAATRLAGLLSLGDTVVISEYSRVIRQAFRILAETDRRTFHSLVVILVSRSGMLLVDDEPMRMAEELRELGAAPKLVPFGEWVDYLINGRDVSGIGEVNTILFGVEAFSLSGDVVYPQIVKELDTLRVRGSREGWATRARVIAAGESYKVCRDYAEVSKMIADPHYTVMPADAFDLVVTDVGEFHPRQGRRVDLASCVASVEVRSNSIREALWPAGTPLPIWNLPSRVVRQVEVVAADIDDTITTDGIITAETVQRIQSMASSGLQVILVTGRSAGWSAGLAQYLPGVRAVVAENGAVLLRRNGSEVAAELLDPEPHPISAVEECLEEILREFPDAVQGKDNFGRLTDRTIEVRDGIDPAQVGAIAVRSGCRHTYSTIHHHITKSSMDKRRGLLRALELLGLNAREPERTVLTVGDSVNDAALFMHGGFAATCGVREVLMKLDLLGDATPEYVTLAGQGSGFDELADLILHDRAAAG